MNKILFFGTDLHGPSTELASKTVKNLSSNFKGSKVLSIKNVKSKKNDNETTIVIPRIFKNRKLRLLVQSILVPIYLTIFRLRGYEKLATFWTVNNRYHYFLFKFLKSIKFKIYFTIISGYNKNYSALSHCDLIICQSQKMKTFISKKFPNKKPVLIHPGIDLKEFFPSTEKNIDVLILSVPYRPQDFHSRGIDKMLVFLRDNPMLRATIVSRSEESAKEIIKLGLKNIDVSHKPLNSEQIADLTKRSKSMPLFYKDQPDMPLSAIEALASGCPIICSPGMGLSKIISEEMCGIITKSPKIVQFNKLFRNKAYSKNARKTAEKYFNISNTLKNYRLALND